MLGSELVAKAAPDGYTFVVSGIGSHVIAPAISPAPFDPMTSFTHIALFGGPPAVLVVHPGLEARNLKEFVALSKSRAGGLSFGSPGQGTHGHLIGEMFKAQSGAGLTHVPYKGAAPAIVDLIAGHIPATSTTLTTAATQIKAGKARALAVTASTRLPEFPDVPTFVETGYPELVANHGWKYDVTGQCVDLPSEPERTAMRERIKLKSYPCLERGGVIWTYMGPPELQPEPPEHEWALVPLEQRFISKRLQECNYLQAMEGGIDSSHVSFLHSAALKRDALFVGAKGNIYNLQDTAPSFEVVEFDGGLLIGARRMAENDQYYWRITPWIVPFYTLVPPRGHHPIHGHAWVPIDDENCWAWSISYHPRRALTHEETAAMRAGQGIPREVHSRHLHSPRQQT